MNREDAIKSIDDYAETSWDMDYRTYENTIRTIDEIFESRKSMICKNCKYFTLCDDDYNYCDMYSRLNGFVTKNFGCNKFERILK